MKPVAKMTKAERAAVLKNPNAKLSDLLEIAALDAIALQRQKRVRFDMSAWVHRGKDKCVVCLAGAALFRDLDIHHQSCDWGRAAAGNAIRINDARSGGTGHEQTDDLIISQYNWNTGRAPFRVYLKAAQKLREAGL